MQDRAAGSSAGPPREGGRRLDGGVQKEVQRVVEHGVEYLFVRCPIGGCRVMVEASRLARLEGATAGGVLRNGLARHVDRHIESGDRLGDELVKEDLVHRPAYRHRPWRFF